MARLTQDTKDKILADFHIGKSQNFLSKKYKCSPATVNKICKGVIPKFKDKVNSVVHIKTELSKESEYQSECFDREVKEKLRRQNLVYGNAEKLADKIYHMTDIVDNANELKSLVDANDRLAITLKVADRHANSQVNVNNTNAQQNNIDGSLQPITINIKKFDE